MGFFQDMLAVFKKRNLSFLDSFQELEDTYTFIFKKENDLNWEAGQHGLFTITHKKMKDGTKPFTIASAPAENVVKITTRISDHPSKFKKALLELEQGMKIGMSGPLGAFYLKEDSPAIFIAGGIGITPFRAILKQIEIEGNTIEKPKHLLYLDSKQSYLFKDELDGREGLINVNYLDSRDSLQQELDQLISTYKDKAQYFIAGPQEMVKTVTGHLQKHHIAKRNIKKDAFFGY